MPLDLISLCIALAVAIIATGVVDAATILPLKRLPTMPRAGKPRLLAGIRVLSRLSRGV